MPLKLGKVSVSSGRALINNKVADWAVIDFKGKFPKEKNTVPHVPLNKSPGKFNVDEGSVVSEDTHLDEFGTLKKGAWYCKVGRSTGLTAGICNGLSAQCQWSKEDRVRYNEHGEQVMLAEGITKGLVISTEADGVWITDHCE